MRKFIKVTLSIMLTILLAACSSVFGEKDLGILAAHPILDKDVKDMVEVLNESTEDTVPELRYGKMEREAFGYSRTLLLVEGDTKGKPKYDLKANYDHGKNLREIKYVFDYGAEDRGETTPTNLMLNMFMYIGIDDNLMDKAFKSATEKEKSASNLWYKINIFMDEESEMNTVSIYSNNHEKDK